jgi:hypothetical protein
MFNLRTSDEETVNAMASNPHVTNKCVDNRSDVKEIRKPINS